MLKNFIFIIFENKNSGVSSLVEIYFFAFREKNNDESEGKLPNGFSGISGI